ncbi:MAG: chemotaxis protein CheC [Gammaproteobacteria bacterium]|nr:chemotaxis protein CheC [Gammaproteobacteria bacterium]
MITLNELQHDTLTEIINIGMGSAAAAMSIMVRDEVNISVPDISFSSIDTIQDNLSGLDTNELASVRQGFDGELMGDAMLLFQGDKSLEIVRLLLSNTMTIDNNDFSDFEQEALSEIGNIILNAGLSAIANTLKFTVNSSLPIYKQGNLNKLMAPSDQTQTVLILRVDLSLETKQIKGYVIYLMDIQSIDLLIEHIDRYINSIPS